jgi:hypothetical protein
MGLTYATAIFVLSILGWVGLVVMEYFAQSLLCAQIAYTFLALGSIHLVATSIAANSRDISQAYFSAVLAFSIYAAGCMADSIQTYTFSPGDFKLPPGPPKCCANLDVVRTNRVLYFTDSILFYVQSGAFLGYVLVHLLLAGAGSLDPETQSVWPGPAWGLGLLALLSVRFGILFNNMVVMLCPDLLYYVHVFEQPIVPLLWIYIAFGVLFLSLLLVEGFPWTLTVWMYWRGLELILCGGFFGVSVGVLFKRGMLTASVIVTLAVPFVPFVIGFVQSIIRKIDKDRETHERRVREFQNRQSEYAPSAPPLQPANPFQYYIPIPLQDDRNKKGL